MGSTVVKFWRTWTWAKSRLKGIFLPAIFLLFLMALAVQAGAAVVQLKPLLDDPSLDPIVLDPADTYELTGEYWLTRSVTIQGNGATIELECLAVTGSDITVRIEECRISSAGWCALSVINGNRLVLLDTTVSCQGRTNTNGIYVEGSALSATNTTISGCEFGVNMVEDTGGEASVAELHTVTMTDILRPVQVRGPSSSVTIDQNSSFSYSYAGDGIGVAVIDGAEGIIRDTSFEGFLNAIDIQPSTPGGTAQVINCRFNNSGSALVAVDAVDVLFSGCTVTNAQTDSVYLRSSTGVIENSEIIGSLNSGVAFLGCSNGAVLRDCSVQESVHQGVAIAAYGTVPSLNILIEGNTFAGNEIANLWVDSVSEATITGNIFTGSPDASVRFHGSKNLQVDSSLVIDSGFGVEIADSADVGIRLSTITRNSGDGVKVYNSAYLNLENSVLWGNGTTYWSLNVTDGAWADSSYSSFIPAGYYAAKNVSGLLSDMSYNYWAAPDGPSGVGTGSGAVINGTKISYQPFLTEPPVESTVATDLALPSAGDLTWDSTLGVVLSLTVKAGAPGLAGETAGVLRVNDTENIGSVALPEGAIRGQVYVVWVSAALRQGSGYGSLKFALPSQERHVELMRREMDGQWTPVQTESDSVRGVLVFSPSDLHQLNGTFVLVQGKAGFNPSILHLLLS